MNKKRMLSVVKMLVAVALIAVLIATIDWKSALSSIVHISAFYVFVLIAIGVFMIAISSIKWQIFLKARGVTVSLYRLMTLYIVGYFFNNLLPGNVGGDMARSFALGQQIGSHSNSMSSVFMERFTGVLGLLILATLALVLNPTVLENTQLGVLLLLLLGGLTFLVVLLFTGLATRILEVLAQWKPRVKPLREAVKVAEAVYSFRSKPKVLAKGMAISFLFHFMTTVNTYAVTRALGLEVSLLDIAVIVPIILVITMIPITPNSIGIWEGAFVFLFGLVGVPPAAALAIALTLRAKNLFFSLLGGVVFFAWKGMFQDRSIDPSTSPPTNGEKDIPLTMTR